jgi:integrase
VQEGTFLVEDFAGDNASLEWLNAQKNTTRSTYKWGWKVFTSEVNMTGDEILADRKNDKVFKWEKVVLDMKVALEKKFSSGTAKGVGIAARSFFAFHRTPLQYRTGEKRRLAEASNKKEDYRFSVPDLRKMYSVADVKERYILCVAKSTGLRGGDFMELNRGTFESVIDREVPVALGRINTSKEHVYARPFLDNDAVKAVKAYLRVMDAEGRTAPTEKMLTYTDESQLSRAIRRMVKRAGIVTGDKRVRFHTMRKFICDHLASYMSTEKWKLVVGKKVHESAYISEDDLRENFARVMPEIAIEQPSIQNDVEKLMKKQSLETYLEHVLKVPRSRWNEYLKMKRPKNLDEEIEAAEEFIREKETKEANCADGEHCQKIVSEDELPAALAKGWKVNAVLPSGKIVVNND